MREIKFRVRDAETKEILGYEEFNTVLNNGFCFYYANDKEHTLHSEFSEPPMIKPTSKIGQLLREQFTGLKDKNGKEIYEGDIIAYTHYECYPQNGNITEHIAVEWVNNGFRPFNYLNDTAVMEVIGNIYENPELLKS